MRNRMISTLAAMAALVLGVGCTNAVDGGTGQLLSSDEVSADGTPTVATGVSDRYYGENDGRTSGGGRPAEPDTGGMADPYASGPPRDMTVPDTDPSGCDDPAGHGDDMTGDTDGDGTMDDGSTDGTMDDGSRAVSF